MHQVPNTSPSILSVFTPHQVVHSICIKDRKNHTPPNDAIIYPHWLNNSPKQESSHPLQYVFSLLVILIFLQTTPSYPTQSLRNKQYCYPSQYLLHHWLVQKPISIFYIYYFFQVQHADSKRNHQFNVPTEIYNQSHHRYDHFWTPLPPSYKLP